LSCTRSTDYNKSASIIGKFEQIEEVTADLTAETANEFSAKISSTGTVLSENYDFINGNCTMADDANFSTATFTCTYNSNIFTVIPSVTAQVNSFSSSVFNTEVFDVTLTDFKVRTEVQSSNGGVWGEQARNISVKVSKQGTDVNKSASIIGKFEQIASDDLCQVIAYASGAQALSVGYNNIAVDTKIKDNCNAYNNTTYVFTSPKDTCYAIAGTVKFAAGSSSDMFGEIADSGGQLANRSGNRNTSSTIFHSKISSTPLCMNQGETLRLRGYTDIAKNTEGVSGLTITELPDTSSIVKNLLAESSQTKCQTKYLSSNTSTTGVMPELTYTNLTVGKKYRIVFNHVTRPTATGVIDSLVVLKYVSGSNIAQSRQAFQTNNSLYNLASFEKTFTATSSSIEFDLVSSVNSEILAGPVATPTEFTTAELCQLPNTYVETTEW